MNAITKTDIEAIVSQDDLAKCGCILKPKTHYRVLRTLHAGRILENPVSLGEFEMRHDAVKVAEDHRIDGSYAIIVPLYECGHDHAEWDRFWRTTN